MEATDQPSEHFLDKRIAANSLMGGVRFLIVSAIYLGLYPFLLKSLGPAQFGLWALLCVPGQYIAIGDFGLSTALIKLVAELSPKHDRDRILQLASTATIVFAVIGGLLMAVIFTWQSEMLHWLRIAPALLPDARVLLTGMAGVIWISLLGNVYTAILSGLHRMDWAHALQIGSSALNALSILILTRWHAGLTGLMLSNAISAVAIWLAAMLLVRRMMRAKWRLMPQPCIEAFRSLIGFSVYISIAALTSLFMEPSVKIMLAHFSSIEYVSFFELASRIVAQCRSLFQFVLLPLLPAASLIMYDRERIKLLYSRSMRFLILTAIPACLALATLATPLVHFWLGKDVPLVQNALALLSLAWLSNILTVPAFLLMQGMNFPRSTMWCAAIQGAVCVVGGYILIPRLGFYGAIYAETAGLILASVYIHMRFFRLCPSTIQETTANPPVRLFALQGTLALALFGIGHSAKSLPIWAWGSMMLVAVATYALLLFRKRISKFTTLDLIRNLFAPGILQKRGQGAPFGLEDFSAKRIKPRSASFPLEQ